ncbi:MFS transporter [Streptomyces huiliensis]|uniref:MFS transporter n=1 Tax=Streptomyces huiliensis TaxID=2876027 RepID=UPI001CBAE5E6|nr:MFS transporter [Streptomyces huiliensis]MBZ4322762.1 MFS transporter [Streptomyces huiliensis]
MGTLLAGASFLLLMAGMPERQFQAWGWRLPFLFSARFGGHRPEGAAFRLRDAGLPRGLPTQQALRLPVLEAVRRRPRALTLAVGALVVGNVLYFVTQTFSLHYDTAVLGIPKRPMLCATLVSLGVQAAVGFAAAVYSDRIGRRRLCLLGAALCGIWAVPQIGPLRTGSLWLIALGFSLFMLVYALYAGPLSAYLAGVFENRFRFTAMALVFNTAVMIGGALAPVAAEGLTALTGSIWAVSALVAATAVISLVSLSRLPEAYPDRLGQDSAQQPIGQETTGAKLGRLTSANERAEGTRDDQGLR